VRRQRLIGPTLVESVPIASGNEPIVTDHGMGPDFDNGAAGSGDSFPRSAWECLPGRSAARCRDRTTRSALDGIPTQSVGTSFSARFRLGAKHAARFPFYTALGPSP